MMVTRRTWLRLASLLWTFGRRNAWAAPPGLDGKTFDVGPSVRGLDRYGGILDLPSPQGSKGFFRVEKFGDRWLFVTPEGHAFWMLGVFNVALYPSSDDLGDSYDNRIVRKYGAGDRDRGLSVWGKQSALRLKSWGFNCAAEYLDIRLWGQIPSVHIANGTSYALENRWRLAPSRTKNLAATNVVDGAVYKGWRGLGIPDVFDPNFKAYWDSYMGQNYPGLKPLYRNPNFLGIATDDRDYLVGFGPGVELPAYSPHPHLGWLVLISNGTASKLAMQEMLRQKYRTIDALNAAWGAKYSTWDSAGGWGGGTGLLDEKGLNRWVGRDHTRLQDVPPAIRADLDAYLYLHAKRYFDVTGTAIRAQIGPHLLFGPCTLNSDGLTRQQILRAAGEACDVVQASCESQQALELTARYVGDKPLVTWETAIANPDSALHRHGQSSGPWIKTTQAERGQWYQDMLSRRFQFRTAAHLAPVAGIKWWEWHDSWSEKKNFGLVSLSDNAYDGREARVATSADPWGYSVGGEARDYSDFISSVRAAHRTLIESLVSELKAKAPTR
jgi:hypothetical protein